MGRVHWEVMYSLRDFLEGLQKRAAFVGAERCDVLA